MIINDIWVLIWDVFPSKPPLLDKQEITLLVKEATCSWLEESTSSSWKRKPWQEPKFYMNGLCSLQSLQRPSADYHHGGWNQLRMRGYKWKSLLSWLPMVCAASEKYNCHPACNCWLIQWETLVLAKPLQKSCCSWNLSRKVSSSSSCMFLWDVYHCFFNAFVMISIIYIYIISQHIPNVYRIQPSTFERGELSLPVVVASGVPWPDRASEDMAS